MAIDQATQQTDALALMPVLDLDAAKRRYENMKTFVAGMLQEDKDYGIIPGTQKKTLLKPGAEKMLRYFGLEAHPEEVEKIEDWDGRDHGGEPFFHFQFRYHLYRQGLYVCGADGSCNSWETKYRYRKGERRCPKCGEATVYKSKNKNKPGWFCWRAKGGCGAEFAAGYKEIESQETGRVLNPEPQDNHNTVLKMAQKRALVAAVLVACNASEFFTVDEDDVTASDDHDERVQKGHVGNGQKAQTGGGAPNAAPATPAAADAEEPDLAGMNRGQKMGLLDKLRKEAGIETFPHWKSWLCKHVREMDSPTDLTDDDIVAVVGMLIAKRDGGDAPDPEPDPPTSGPRAASAAEKSAEAGGPKWAESDTGDPFTNGNAESAAVRPAPAAEERPAESDLGDGTEEELRDPFAATQAALPLTNVDPTTEYLLSAEIPTDRPSRAKLLAQILRALGIEGTSVLAWCQQQGYKGTALGYQDWNALAAMITIAREQLKGCHATEGRAA